MRDLLTSGNLHDAMRPPQDHRAKFRLYNVLFSATLLISACYTHKQMACQVILGIVCAFLLQVVQKWEKITNYVYVLAADYWCSQRADYYFKWRTGVILLIMHYSNLCSFLSFLWRSSKYDCAPSQPLPGDVSYSNHRRPTPAAC